MKLRRLTICLLVALAGAVAASAAVRDLPVRMVNGHPYHYYTVQRSETVYALCHKLDISKADLVKYNPSVADGLKAGTTLFFPAEDNVVLTPDNASHHGIRMVSHTVKKGETIYGIANTYGLTTDALIEQNPVVREGLKSGQVLHLNVPIEPAKTVTNPQAAPAAGAAVAVTPSGYIVKKKGETFYSIAKAHDVSVGELEAANPGITVLKVGQVLSIPAPGAPATEELTSSPSTGRIPVGADGTVSLDDFAVASGVAATTAAAPAAVTEELSVAVILPFMLNEETPSKSAQRYTEFYKGFLMAVDSMRNNGVPIRITAYDSEGSTWKVRKILEDSTLKSHRMIIAPDASDQLSIIADYAAANGQKVFNTFIVRDETYLTNPAVMQGNIPSQQMLEKAVAAMAERLAYTTPVFVTLADGANDKADFINALKQRIQEKGGSWQTIEADGKLTPANLKILSAEGNYTFIPTSGRQSDLNRIMPALIEWRDEEILPLVRLMGYPEWITFRGETLQNMHNLNTTVYSRFFVDDDDVRTRRLEDKYKGWYGAGMEMAIPRQGILGFDTGMFILEYLRNPAMRYDGVQNGYNFMAPESAEGRYNNVLYLINFRSGNTIEKINL